jgi:hypothetical protein
MDSGLADRGYWVDVARRLAEPVLTALAGGQLKQVMPVEARPQQIDKCRATTHLEAVGRLLAGIAP